MKLFRGMREAEDNRRNDSIVVCRFELEDAYDYLLLDRPAVLGEI